MPKEIRITEVRMNANGVLAKRTDSAFNPRPFRPSDFGLLSGFGNSDFGFQV
jgi:hypothetical protein